jgi:hypothetical protein
LVVLAVLLTFGSPSVFNPFLGSLELSAEPGTVNIESGKKEVVVVGKSADINVYSESVKFMF